MLAESTMPEHSLTKLLVWLWTFVSLLFLSVWRPLLPPCDLAQLEKTHYLLLKCFLLSEGSDPGDRGRAEAPGPHVGSTDVGVNR